jgi:hypothetical protein
MSDDKTSSDEKTMKQYQRPKRPHCPYVRLEISDDIIRMAVKRDSSHCMVAEGVRAVSPNARSIAVDVQTIRWSDPERGLRYTYLTPRLVQEKIVQFDQGVLPEAFSFQLRQGQVTLMMKRRNSGAAPRPRTPAQLANDERFARLNKKEFRAGFAGVPTVSGGTPPPLSSFARRRAFGLRALKV